MKVGLYARVSTKEQDYQIQIDRMKEYCHRNGWEIVEIFKEKASATTTNRPEFQRMMAMAEAKKIDAIVITKLDRFARSLADLLINVKKLDELGIKFIVVDDSIDTSTPSGKLLMQLLGAIGEFERSIILERTRHGRERALQKGIACHRPKLKLPDEEIKKLFVEKRLSINAIAKFYNVSAPTIWNRLREMGIDTSGAK